MNWNNLLKLSIFLLVILLITNVKTCDVDLVVQTANGQLMGRDNDYYISYERIPYAKAPVDELRFEPPQPYDTKWKDIYDASQKPIVCLQWDQLTEGENKLQGSEDCLYLNIYKPKTRKKKYPVMTYLHGGAFMFGTVDTFGEDYLMKRGNVILVTISYRLGPLGFLSTEDEVISGNYGLKDQRLALKWIKENIHYFNGDPDKILLMGFSAGAASSHLHMLLPQQPDLLKVVVSNSGAALNPWVIIKNPLKRTLKLAQHLQCPNLEDTQAIKQCLQEKPAEDIVASVKEFLNSGYNPFTTFGPVVEHKNSLHAFMTEHPRDIIKSGNYPAIPWLVTFTAEDGGYNAAELLLINPKTGVTYLDELNTKWLDLAPSNLFLENIHDEPQQYAQQLRDTYLGDLTISEENYLKVQEIYTDILFKNGIVESMQLHSQNNKGPVYGYVYDNPSDINVGHYLSHREDMYFGTVHSDDFSLIMSFYIKTLRSDEEIISQKFMKMLEDFVTEGDLAFGDCKFVNNAGKSDKIEILLITRDNCENKVV